MNKIDHQHNTNSIAENSGKTPGVCRKEIPLWLIVLDNVPTLALFGLGTVLMIQFHIISGIIYFVYILFSILWFWAKICPCCYSFGTRRCPCGFGIISSKLFKRKSGKNFTQIFKRNIPVLYPAWFIPPVAGIYLLVNKFSYFTLFYLVLFCFTGFFIIPFISKVAGCKNCLIKNDCPWMK